VKIIVPRFAKLNESPINKFNTIVKFKDLLSKGNLSSIIGHIITSTTLAFSIHYVMKITSLAL